MNIITRSAAIAMKVGTVLLHKKGKQTATVTETCTVYEGNNKAFSLPVVSPNGAAFCITAGNADRWSVKGSQQVSTPAATKATKKPAKAKLVVAKAVVANG